MKIEIEKNYKRYNKMLYLYIYIDKILVNLFKKHLLNYNIKKLGCMKLPSFFDLIVIIYCS